MGMSTRVVGVRDLGGQFDKMMKAKLACDDAGIGYPKEVEDYFEYPKESEECIRKGMQEIDIGDAVDQINRDGTSGYEVDLSKLSSEVKAIRFTNNW